MNRQYHHKPVLLKETIEKLEIKPGGRYIDATIGGGGHAEEMLKAGAVVLGIDQDKDAIKNLSTKFKNKLDQKIILVQDNFKNIKKIAREKDFVEADGILFDLGISSHQLDVPERGFSYRFTSPLDMRMSSKNTITASQIVNSYPEEKLEKIFATFAELDNAHKIARAIAEARKKREIMTTTDLIESIEKKNKLSNKEKSRVFQALRMEVNQEIKTLKESLPDAFEILSPSARMAVISFHSLEDRIVKEFFRESQNSNKAKLVNKKPITAKEDEVKVNKRARSAKLRVIEKL